MGEAVVAVRGESILEVEPEIATVIVTLQAQDRDRARALATLDTRHRNLLGLLDEYQAATEAVESGGVHVQPQFKDEKPREKVTGHLAMRGVTVRVTEFSVLGELLGRVAADESHRLDGPYWSLRPTSPVILEARTSAVRDAVSRARAYATALGGTITELREVADLGLGGGGERGHGMAMAAAGFPSRASRFAEPIEFDVTPEPQTVHGAVEARFTMTGADLSIVP